MASLAHMSRALKNRRSAKDLFSVVIRHGSGSRGRDINPALQPVRSDVIGCANGNTGSAVPLTQVRFLPMNNAPANVSDKALSMSCKPANELNGTPANGGCSAAAGGVGGATGFSVSTSNSMEKVAQGLLYGRRLKRSSETIRHDKLYLQRSDFSQREYTQTWNDFQGKRSIPTTEWGNRNRSDE